jgi:hypothetical protein
LLTAVQDNPKEENSMLKIKELTASNRKIGNLASFAIFFQFAQMLSRTN